MLSPTVFFNEVHVYYITQYSSEDLLKYHSLHTQKYDSVLLTVQVPAVSKLVSDGECQQIILFNDYYWHEAKLITHANSPVLFSFG